MRVCISGELSDEHFGAQDICKVNIPIVGSTTTPYPLKNLWVPASHHDNVNSDCERILTLHVCVSLTVATGLPSACHLESPWSAS